MKLNGITCADYQLKGNNLVYFILDTDFKSAAGLEGQSLLVKEGNTKVAEFGGYHLTGIENYADGMLKVSFARNLEPDTEQVLSELLTNLGIAQRDIKKNASSISDVSNKVVGVDTKAQGASESAEQANSSVFEINEQLDIYAGAIEELATMVADSLATE